MGIEEVFPRPITPLHVSDIVVQTWLIMAVLTLLAYLAGKRLQIRPRGWQHFLEIFTEFVDRLILQRTKRPVRGVFELIATMMLYIAVANLLGLLPMLRAPTRSLNTTIALGIVSFVSVQYLGVRERGVLRYLRSFAEPMVFMLPLNILGLFSRTVAMCLRLFGNVIAGEICGAVMSQLLPLAGAIPFNLLGTITGVVQSLVFTSLTVAFIAEAIGAEI
jgi:F-type H+-transporting ATPase subunit a